MSHNYKNNGMGAWICQTCNHIQTIPDTPCAGGKTIEQPQEEFDLDKRIDLALAMWPTRTEELLNDTNSNQRKAIKQLIAEVLEYVKPDREPDKILPSYHPKKNEWNKAIDELEANTRKVLGDE